MLDLSVFRRSDFHKPELGFGLHQRGGATLLNLSPGLAARASNLLGGFTKHRPVRTRQDLSRPLTFSYIVL